MRYSSWLDEIFLDRQCRLLRLMSSDVTQAGPLGDHNRARRTSCPHTRVLSLYSSHVGTELDV